MKVQLHAQHPATPSIGTLKAYLNKELSAGKYDEVRVAVAYMTVAGLQVLRTSLSPHKLKKSQWLIGLDDHVTHPGAIEALLNTENTDIRVVSHADKALRFHPKVFMFGKHGTPANYLTLLGSANLTASALGGNSEAVAIMEPQGQGETDSLDQLWSKLWALGHKPTKAELDQYKLAYEKLAARRKQEKAAQKAPKKHEPILESDDAELDPSVATRCWIECGFNTALGRELEFKAEQGLFFGLAPTGEDPRSFEFEVSSGALVKMRMKYQGNHMWRLQLSRDVPEVAKGLRPKKADGTLGRSPYVAVFDRTKKKGTYKLFFVRLTSPAFKKILSDSKADGTSGKTSARQYGWC